MTTKKKKSTADFNSLIGRCRCGEHAQRYTPQRHNRHRTYYFLPEDRTPPDLLCGACMQGEDKPTQGGLILSEEAKRKGIVAFQAFAAYRLSPEQLNSLTRVWPRP